MSVRRWALPAAVALLLLVALELLSRADTSILPRQDVPPPTTIFQELWFQMGREFFWSSLRATLEGWIFGLGLAVGASVLIGIVVGSSRWLYRSVQYLIELLRPLPGIAMLPLVILIFGLGIWMKVSLIAYACFWPMLFQTLYGVQDVDPVTRDMSRAYGLNRVQQLRWITLPSATPYIATGVRLAATIALVVGIGVELIVGGASGIGSAIQQAQSFGLTATLWAYVVFAGFLGLLINVGFRRLERRFLRWHASQRELYVA